METKGKIAIKKSDNKAFKLGDDWYNVNDNIISDLTKISKGDDVIITYEKRGVSRYVSKIVLAGNVPSSSSNIEEKKTENSEFVCEVCGKPLKDGKYKKCYTCNKSGATKPVSESTDGKFKCITCGTELKDGKYKKCYKCGKESRNKGGKNYDSPEKTAQIQRGNALNAAASVASGQDFKDPDTASQFTILLAQKFLDWLRLTE